jgi:hypothetical protein
MSEFIGPGKVFETEEEEFAEYIEMMEWATVFTTPLSRDSEGLGPKNWAVYKCSRCGGLVLDWAYEDSVLQPPQGTFPGEKQLDDSIPNRARNYLNRARSSLYACRGGDARRIFGGFHAQEQELHRRVAERPNRQSRSGSPHNSRNGGLGS